MNIQIDRPAVALARNELARFDNASGARVLCTFGSLWITVDHDTRDIILSLGESFDVESDARVVLTAMDASSFVVCKPAVHPSI